MGNRDYVCNDGRHDRNTTISFSILKVVIYDGNNTKEVSEFLGDDFTGHGLYGGVIWFSDPCCGNTRSIKPGETLMLHSNGGYTTF